MVHQSLVCLLLSLVVTVSCSDPIKSRRENDPFFLPKFDFKTILKKMADKLGWKPIRLYFPGTKWCGIGRKAKHFNDLGSLKDIDICCREHDLCRGAIHVGETKYGYRNDLKQTLLPCFCDQQFANCLRGGNSLRKYLFGHMVFGVVKLKCYVVKQINRFSTQVTLHTTRFTASVGKWKNLIFGK